MQLKTFILTLFLAAALPLLAYEAPITEPGATGVNDLYTTTYSNPGGPNRAGGPNRIGETGGTSAGDVQGDPGTAGEGSPVGAPWVLLGFAAAYGAFRLKKKQKEE